MSRTQLYLFRWGLVLIGFSAASFATAVHFGAVCLTRTGAGSCYQLNAASKMFSAAGTLLMAVAVVLTAFGARGLLRLFPILIALLTLVCAAGNYEITTDKVVIGPRRMLLPGYGFPRHPYYQIPYDQITAAMVTRSKTSRSADKDDFELVILRPGDADVRVPVGDLLRAAMPEVLAALHRCGVPVVDFRRS